jgi:hypothetical protein
MDRTVRICPQKDCARQNDADARHCIDCHEPLVTVCPGCRGESSVAEEKCAHCGGTFAVLGKARRLLDAAGILLRDLNLVRAAERAEGAVHTLAGAVGAGPLLKEVEDLRAQIEEVVVRRKRKQQRIDILIAAREFDRASQEVERYISEDPYDEALPRKLEEIRALTCEHLLAQSKDAEKENDLERAIELALAADAGSESVAPVARARAEELSAAKATLAALSKEASRLAEAGDLGGLERLLDGVVPSITSHPSVQEERERLHRLKEEYEDLMERAGEALAAQNWVASTRYFETAHRLWPSEPRAARGPAEVIQEQAQSIAEEARLEFHRGRARQATQGFTRALLLDENCRLAIAGLSRVRSGRRRKRILGGVGLVLLLLVVGAFLALGPVSSELMRRGDTDQARWICDRFPILIGGAALRAEIAGHLCQKADEAAATGDILGATRDRLAAAAYLETGAERTQLVKSALAATTGAITEYLDSGRFEDAWRLTLQAILLTEVKGLTSPPGREVLLQQVETAEAGLRESVRRLIVDESRLEFLGTEVVVRIPVGSPELDLRVSGESDPPPVANGSFVFRRTFDDQDIVALNLRVHFAEPLTSVPVYVEVPRDEAPPQIILKAPLSTVREECPAIVLEIRDDSLSSELGLHRLQIAAKDLDSGMAIDVGKIPERDDTDRSLTLRVPLEVAHGTTRKIEFTVKDLAGATAELAVPVARDSRTEQPDLTAVGSHPLADGKLYVQAARLTVIGSTTDDLPEGDPLLGCAVTVKSPGGFTRTIEIGRGQVGPGPDGGHEIRVNVDLEVGENRIRFCAKDRLGNDPAESNELVVVRDDEPPVVTPNLPVPGEAYFIRKIDGVTYVLGREDPVITFETKEANPAKVEVEVDEELLCKSTTIVEPLRIGKPGRHVINCFAVDRAGREHRTDLEFTFYRLPPGVVVEGGNRLFHVAESAGRQQRTEMVFVPAGQAESTAHAIDTQVGPSLIDRHRTSGTSGKLSESKARNLARTRGLGVAGPEHLIRALAFSRSSPQDGEVEFGDPMKEWVAVSGRLRLLTSRVLLPVVADQDDPFPADFRCFIPLQTE